ncbi:MAG: rhomboid family intramembrane serine protease [Candidatus Nanohaloarchaea archaeon]
MAECSKCGKESMSFTCKYCGEKYCSEHRLPEKHDCDGLEEKLEEEKEKEEDQWFQENKVKNPAPSRTEREFRKPSIKRDLKEIITSNVTLSIIGFTTLVFAVQSIISSSPGSQAYSAFYSLLILDPALSSVLAKPWTLLTVMILHGGLFHLFANMVTFYFFGSPIERLVGGKKLLKFYAGAGLAASLGFVFFRNLLFLLHGEALRCIVPGACGGMGVLGPAVGASGAVVACFAAVSRLYPDAEVLLYFIIPLKIRTAFLLFAGFEGINMLVMLLGYTVPIVGGLAFSAHFTGLIVGLWFGERIKKKVNTRSSRFELLAR